MPVRLRLQRHGRSKRPFYFIVAADSRSPRDGAYIERIGDYNPLSVPATINIDADKAFDWVMKGAEPTNTVKKILTYKGVLYKKHLYRGVRKGAFTQEEADKKFADWVESKKGSISDRIDALNAAKKEARQQRIDAENEKRTARATAKAAIVTEEAPAAEVETETTATETDTTATNTETTAAE
ncbi:MAG: 30S ribosomal protein S16 [Bacteroidota bacterium]